MTMNWLRLKIAAINSVVVLLSLHAPLLIAALRGGRKGSQSSLSSSSSSLDGGLQLILTGAKEVHTVDCVPDLPNRQFSKKETELTLTQVDANQGSAACTIKTTGSGFLGLGIGRTKYPTKIAKAQLGLPNFSVDGRDDWVSDSLFGFEKRKMKQTMILFPDVIDNAEKWLTVEAKGNMPVIKAKGDKSYKGWLFAFAREPNGPVVRACYTPLQQFTHTPLVTFGKKKEEEKEEKEAKEENGSNGDVQNESYEDALVATGGDRNCYVASSQVETKKLGGAADALDHLGQFDVPLPEGLGATDMPALAIVCHQDKSSPSHCIPFEVVQEAYKDEESTALKVTYQNKYLAEAHQKVGKGVPLGYVMDPDDNKKDNKREKKVKVQKKKGERFLRPINPGKTVWYD